MEKIVEWVPVPGFDKYEFNKYDGQIRQKKNGKVLEASTKGWTVRLRTSDGSRKTVSPARLVREGDWPWKTIPEGIKARENAKEPSEKPSKKQTRIERDGVRARKAKGQKLVPRSAAPAKPKYDERTKRKVKLNPLLAKKIRGLRKEGWYLREIAEEFGVHVSTVSEICSNKLYKIIKTTKQDG